MRLPTRPDTAAVSTRRIAEAAGSFSWHAQMGHCAQLDEDAVDAERTRYIEAQGFRVIRFWNNDVLGNLDGVIEDIMRVVADMPSPNPSRKREGS